MEALLKEAERFYLTAAAVTYAADAAKVAIADLPGSRVYRWGVGRWRYVDIYFVGRGGRSFGTTLLYHPELAANGPFWWLHYHGQAIRPEATAFLERVLRDTYKAGTFYGGRGPSVFHQAEVSPWIYMNQAVCADFGAPQGREEIRTPISSGRDLLFWHEYRGGLLI